MCSEASRASEGNTCPPPPARFGRGSLQASADGEIGRGPGLRRPNPRLGAGGRKLTRSDLLFDPRPAPNSTPETTDSLMTRPDVESRNVDAVSPSRPPLTRKAARPPMEYAPKIRVETSNVDKPGRGSAARLVARALPIVRSRAIRPDLSRRPHDPGTNAHDRGGLRASSFVGARPVRVRSSSSRFRCEQDAAARIPCSWTSR